MFNPFKKRALYYEIERYAREKSERYPIAAHIDKDVLLLFFTKFRIESVTDVTLEQVREFVEIMPTYFRKFEAAKTLRNFLRYHALRGYGCDSVYALVKKERV